MPLSKYQNCPNSCFHMSSVQNLCSNKEYLNHSSPILALAISSGHLLLQKNWEKFQREAQNKDFWYPKCKPWNRRSNVDTIIEKNERYPRSRRVKLYAYIWKKENGEMHHAKLRTEYIDVNGSPIERKDWYGLIPHGLL